LVRPFIFTLAILAAGEIQRVEGWMTNAFYPALLLILIVASLGIPIPEDIPLIVAGVILRNGEGIATWYGTFVVALAGIMCGDLVLYTLGRRWGPEVVNHRSVRWMVTPERFRRVSHQFQVHGAWMVFFGRFFMGVRAAMCLTAGATRFPYVRFLAADLAGASLSIPLFVFLGYWFADMIPTLRRYIGGVQTALLLGAIIAVVIVFLAYRARKRRRSALRADAGE
jgi:membrane protein DedA with SNARE-associated domain